MTFDTHAPQRGRRGSPGSGAAVAVLTALANHQKAFAWWQHRQGGRPSRLPLEPIHGTRRSPRFGCVRPGRSSRERAKADFKSPAPQCNTKLRTGPSRFRTPADSATSRLAPAAHRSDRALVQARLLARAGGIAAGGQQRLQPIATRTPATTSKTTKEDDQASDYEQVPGEQLPPLQLQHVVRQRRPHEPPDQTPLRHVSIRPGCSPTAKPRKSLSRRPPPRRILLTSPGSWLASS